MILTDRDILNQMKEGHIEIEPFDRSKLGTNSYDLTLSKHLAVYTGSELDAKLDNPIHRFEIPEEGYLLIPNVLYLGATNERTRSKTHMPYIGGKSSTGRLGISVHVTAGEGDVGFNGNWTLEITAVMPVRVYPDMPIAQILFMLTYSNPLVPYSLKESAKYQGQGNMPMPSQMFKNFKS